MGNVHQMHSLYVSSVSTLCWYYYTIACYGIGTIIPDCDCQHGILSYRIHRLPLGISDMDRFC